MGGIPLEILHPDGKFYSQDILVTPEHILAADLKLSQFVTNMQRSCR